MKLWTIYGDYYATGEGRTISALITYAENEKNALNEFSKTFGDFFVLSATAEEGIVKNEVVRMLFNDKLFKRLEETEGLGNAKLSAQYHFNFA